MPKKTKREKILAELHRKLITLDASTKSVKSQNQIGMPQAQSVKLSSFTYHSGSVTKPNSLQKESSYAYIKHDLIRITIFTLFATIFQSVLYFLLRTR